MCGIAGALKSRGGELPPSTVLDMIAPLSHRGPDESGSWVNEDGSIQLGHRRLAVVGLGPTGSQPMVSPNGRYTITFNGEVYNYSELGSSLRFNSPTFRGYSDTEVLLSAIQEWGVHGALRETRGMFALALWDHKKRVLYLARDRLGQKPLYYTHNSETLFFASELKAFNSCPGLTATISVDMVATYLRFGFIPSPYSIYENIFKVSPGSLLSFDADQSLLDAKAQTYWSLSGVAHATTGCDDGLSDSEALDKVQTALNSAVAEQSHADVPVGAFLSGGIDSSLVVALLRKQRTDVKTFSIGFHSPKFNEAGNAKEIAEHLGTIHSELYISGEDAARVLPNLPYIYDEPFADSSQIPSLFVSRLASNDVTVALSGDGGDEMFAGYDRHRILHSLWPRISSVPLSLRRRIGAIVGKNPSGVAKIYNKFAPILPTNLRLAHTESKLNKLSPILSMDTADDVHHHLLSYWRGSATPSFRGLPMVLPNDEWAPARGISRVLYRDSTSYLPDDILTKMDRASMAYSLEARMPFLDHRVVELAWRLNDNKKLRSRQTKWILRRLLAQYVPPRLFDRPQMGFSVPMGDWLRGPLRAWAEELLSTRSLKDGDYLDPCVIRSTWSDHLRGQNRENELWTVLMFQAWRLRWASTQFSPCDRG